MPDIRVIVVDSPATGVTAAVAAALADVAKVMAPSPQDIERHLVPNPCYADINSWLMEYAEAPRAYGPPRRGKKGKHLRW